MPTYLLLDDSSNVVKKFTSLKEEFPNTSFTRPYPQPEELPANVVEVHVLPQPVPSPFQLPQPTAEVFNPATGRWEQGWELVVLPEAELAAALVREKNILRESINGWRLKANFSHFTHQGKSFQCDTLSRSDIDGINGYVATHDAFPPGFPNAWKAMDNSYLPLPDIAAWKDFYSSMIAAGSLNFAHAQTLKTQLEAISIAPGEDGSAANAALNAITW